MGLMDFINEKIIDSELNENDREEKRQTKKKFKTAKKSLKDMTADRDLYRDKYIAILEEKGEGFNQYLFWQNKANESEADEKEARKELTDARKDLKDYDTVVGRLFTKEPVTSLAKCETFDDFLNYILRIHFTDKDLPLKGIQDVCKKLNITKYMIKKESEYLYKTLGVEKWEIE